MPTSLLSVRVAWLLFQSLISWAPTVHDAILAEAFRDSPSGHWRCLLEMQRGSRFVDVEYQATRYSYRHAMRGPQDATEAEAAHRTWQYIEDTYAEANAVGRRKGRGNWAHSPDACFVRGQALHAVMDSTSPAHAGYAEWRPLRHPMQVFDHGDWSQKILARLGLHGLVRGADSKEDWIYLDTHPWAVRETAALVRAVDDLFGELVGETLGSTAGSSGGRR